MWYAIVLVRNDAHNVTKCAPAFGVRAGDDQEFAMRHAPGLSSYRSRAAQYIGRRCVLYRTENSVCVKLVASFTHVQCGDRFSRRLRIRTTLPASRQQNRNTARCALSYATYRYSKSCAKGRRKDQQCIIRRRTVPCASNSPLKISEGVRPRP